jgi:ABC-2 type transport system permease protein
VLPALVLNGLMFRALRMLSSSVVKQLENFTRVMNFVIFPMFFASSAPLSAVAAASLLLFDVCCVNPFTYEIELVRFVLYREIDWLSLGLVVGSAILFTVTAILAYDPAQAF